MLYLIQSGEFLKIGYTDNIEKRINQYKTHNPDYVLLAYRDGNRCDETLLHSLLSDYFVDNTEWMKSNIFILDLFCKVHLNGVDNKVYIFYEVEKHNIISDLFLSRINEITSLNALKLYLWMKSHKNNKNICYLTTKQRQTIMNLLKISSNTITNNLKVLKDLNFIEGDKGEFIVY